MDKDKQNRNFACCFVWVWNLVVRIEGGTLAEGLWEQGAEENIWAQEGRGNAGLDKTTQLGA